MFSVDDFDQYWPSLSSQLRYFSKVDSTNDTALLFKGEDGAIILSEAQKKGRGRNQSSWYSEPGKSLTFSLVLHTLLPLQARPRFALGAGLAIVQVLEQQRLLAEVKWPNDVLIQGKKICGILVESIPQGAIVGIGVNIEPFESEQHFERDAVSVKQGGDSSMAREWWLGAFVQQCQKVFAQCETDFASVIQALNERLAWKGMKVEYKNQEGRLQSGVIESVADDGSLVLRIGGKLERLYSASEIQVVS